MKTRALNSAGWNYFNENECGYRELWNLFKLVRSQTGGSTPLVIDADDLVDDPGASALLFLFFQFLSFSFCLSVLSFRNKKSPL